MVVGRRIHVEGVQTDPFAEIPIAERNVLQVSRSDWKQSHDDFAGQSALPRNTVDRPADAFEAIAEVLNLLARHFHGPGAQQILEPDGTKVGLPVALVDPEPDLATGFDHFAYLHHRPFGIGGVLDHSDAVGIVEGSRPERHFVDRSLDHIEMWRIAQVSLAGLHRLAEVHSRHFRTGGQRDLCKAPGTATRVEDFLAL